jgi:hypothetical protein
MLLMPGEYELWRRMGEEILQSPDDDRLRRLFAGLLESGDDADEETRNRARIIRIQLRLASMDADHPEWLRLAAQALHLFLRYQRAWVPEVYQRFGRPQFHRGFLELITIPAKELAESSSWIFSEAPIRHLDIIDMPGKGYVQDLFNRVFSKAPAMSRLLSLRLDGQGITDADIAFLTTLPWKNLGWLSLANNEIQEAGVAALANRLKALRFVDLHGNPFDPIDELTFDQDVVVNRQRTPFGEEHPEVPWLQRELVSGQVVYPNRFEVVRERPIEIAGPAFAQ